MTTFLFRVVARAAASRHYPRRTSHQDIPDREALQHGEPIFHFSFVICHLSFFICSECAPAGGYDNFNDQMENGK